MGTTRVIVFDSQAILEQIEQERRAAAHPIVAPDYAAWIAAYAEREEGFLLGKCDRATEEMVRAFPELRRVAGHVSCSWGKRGHYWCETADGTVVDPTRTQFPGPIEYEEFQPGQLVLAGKCMDCGDEIWLPLKSLDDYCENPHHPFCSAPCEPAFARSLVLG